MTTDHPLFWIALAFASATLLRYPVREAIARWRQYRADEESTAETHRWIDYYGDYWHADHRCAELGTTLWVENDTDRNPCPECTDE